jgi:hypothetical protein
MDKRFIRIGSRHIPVDHILGIDTNYHMDDGTQSVHIVLQSIEIDGACGIDALASFSMAINYPHGTPEAKAITHWLESQSLDLLAREEAARGAVLVDPQSPSWVVKGQDQCHTE